MIKIWRIILSGTLILASVARLQPVQAGGIDCDDVKFVFARGSGEPLGASNAQKWQKEITATIAGSDLDYDFYELGTRDYGGHQYEAVAVSGSLSSLLTLVGAKISAGESYKFGQSVKSGEQELLAYIQAVNSSCPQTKFVLGGYSQGAMLVSHSLNYIDPDKIIYVTNFGDPKTYLPEGKGNFPDACLGKNLSNYRAHVADCHAYEGILGSYRPYQLEGYYDKIGLWCNGQDAMCSSGLSIDAHVSYVDNGMYERAAAKIAQRLREAFPEQADFEIEASLVTTQDVAIILDTSPSMMQGPYNLYLMRIRQLVNEVRSLGGRVALFYYGDFRYFRPGCICDFETCTPEKIDEFYNKYAEIGIIAHWWYNSGISAAYKAVTELNWRDDADKSIVIFTNQSLSPADMDRDYLLEANQVVGAKISMYVQHGLYFDEAIVEATGGKVYSESNNIETLTMDLTGRLPAELPTSQYIGSIHQEIYFNASEVARELQQQKSSAKSRRRSPNSETLHYDWDLDGDGIFEIIDGPAQVTKQYNQPSNGFVQVKVRNDNGDYRIALSRLRITDEDSNSAETPALRATVERVDPTSYRVNFDTEARYLLVSLDNVIVGRIDPNNPKFIVIEDIQHPTTLRLVTYSEEQGRGQAVELLLGADLPSDEDSTDDNVSGDQDGTPGQNGNPTPDHNDQNDSVSGQPNDYRPGLSQLPTINQIAETLQPSQPSNLPKAPNAGVAGYARELRCQ